MVKTGYIQRSKYKFQNNLLYNLLSEARICSSIHQLLKPRQPYSHSLYLSIFRAQIEDVSLFIVALSSFYCSLATFSCLPLFLYPYFSYFV